MSTEADVMRAIEVLRRRADDTMRGVVREMLRRVVTRTPHRTGHAMGNWRVGNGGPVSGEFEIAGSRDAMFDRVMGRESEVIDELRYGDAAYVSNDVPYIERLEHGWSRQAPLGMVAVTAAEAAQIVEQVVGDTTNGD
jgi:hypothetical protein